MAYRELTMIDVKEVLRRWLAGHGVRHIARDGGVDRKTVRRYVHAAEVCGLEPGGELSDELVHQVALRVQSRMLPAPSEQRSQLLERREQLRDWLEADEPLRLSKVHVLLERRGVQVSYSTLRRFAIEELGWRKRPVTVRLDDPPPGQEAQADFGRLGMIVDPATGSRRTVWALIVTLSFSRHMFVWPTYRQTTEAVCEGLEMAWRFFDGVEVSRVSKRPARYRLSTASRSFARKRRPRTRTGKRNPGSVARHVPSSRSPPPVTTQCTCGWKDRSRLQVCRTAVSPSLAPR